MIQRGSICWADLGDARGGRPAERRPVLVIQSDPFNASRLSIAMPGNEDGSCRASGNCRTIRRW